VHKITTYLLTFGFSKDFEAIFPAKKSQNRMTIKVKDNIHLQTSQKCNKRADSIKQRETITILCRENAHNRQMGK